ncbi:MAG: NADH-quinone oxidoreductase subunit M [Candidatus Rokubacteria bacterium]|nr:NADH-quinone oxidoreductase subunit M [Candidatus Rokubacteria bacterium]
MKLPILSLVTFLPLLGGVVIALFPRGREALVRWLAFLVSTAAFALSLLLYFGFDAGSPDYQFVEQVRWMPSFGISYHLGVDGISLLLVLLTTFLSPLALLSSWRAVEVRVKEFAASMLLLETGMLGVFVSLDLFLFYIFWEAMLIPMYLIIGVWGGPARIYAAIKFILYTLAGSVLMLVAILALYFHHGGVTGIYTFDLPLLTRYVVPGGIQLWLFLAFAVAFAIKVPMFPFHTWLPDAHVEAPTAGSVILAGVLLKMGTYGFLRFCLPLFPQASLAATPWIFLLALIGIIYGAWVSMVQPDLKKLVAYSSVSHLGFVVLGLFTLTPQGIVGGLIQMVNHGLSTGALFLLVGILYERRHTRLIAEFGGLWQVVPAFSALLMIVALSSLGLPGLNGFVGEFLILVGAFAWAANLSAAGPPAYLVPVLATSGIIFAAVYLLWMYQRVCFGEITAEANRGLTDLTRREWAVLLPVLLFIVWIGVYPRPFTGKTEASVQALIAQVQSKAAAAAPAQPDLQRIHASGAPTPSAWGAGLGGR